VLYVAGSRRGLAPKAGFWFWVWNQKSHLQLLQGCHPPTCHSLQNSLGSSVHFQLPDSPLALHLPRKIPFKLSPCSRLLAPMQDHPPRGSTWDPCSTPQGRDLRNLLRLAGDSSMFQPLYTGAQQMDRPPPGQGRYGTL
jgi:hypothetical protein